MNTWVEIFKSTSFGVVGHESSCALLAKAGGCVMSGGNGGRLERDCEGDVGLSAPSSNLVFEGDGQ